ncbi:hypothetical protein ZWY2020_048466 [Hordeum vulgare]|nr:hypothetical protein ZWY2020_048466 [Hordeum vulgare]
MEAVDIEERWEDELRMAEDEVEKSLSVEQSAVEDQRKLLRSHYYDYYYLVGSAEDEYEDGDAVNFSRGDVQSTNDGMSPRQFIDVSSYTDEA